MRFVIVPRDHGVLLVLDHRRLAPDSAPGYGAGWHAHLDALAKPFTLDARDRTALYRERLPAYRRHSAV